MLFERIEVDGLAHYSYAVGCAGEKEIAIIDPERNIDRYLAFADQRGMKITHILETHIHADYASGARALGEATGAPVLASGYDKGEKYTVTFTHQDFVEGDAIAIGRVRIVARHTPGHTPEHLSLLVYDTARSSDAPILMLTGDFLFVGSLGRPDLLGEEAKRELARKLYQSTRNALKDLPDGVEIHPAHGAGSMCGAGMSGRPSSTLGYERIANPYLDPTLTEEAFVERILGSAPPFPPYYRRMKEVNSVGAKWLRALPGEAAIEPNEVQAMIKDRGAVIVDLRKQQPFSTGHIPGAFCIGHGKLLAIWASWVVPYDTPVILLADHASQIEDAAKALIRVGLDEIVGHVRGGIKAWENAELPIETNGLITPSEAHQRMQAGDLHLIDVRTDAEWEKGHAPGAQHVFGGFLSDRLDELPPRDEPIAVTCGGGYRSAVAASVLQRAGFTNVIDLAGGMGAWQRAGLPLEQQQPASVR